MSRPYFAPRSAVLVRCPRTRDLLPRTVQEHLIIGPRAGMVIVVTAEGKVEHWPVEAVQPGTDYTVAA